MRRHLRAAAAALVALLAGMAPVGGGAAEPDWTAIQYADGVGCGLFVQFFAADGAEPTMSPTSSPWLCASPRP